MIVFFLSVATRASISSGWYSPFAAALFLFLPRGLLLLFLLGYCGLVCCGSAGAAGRARRSTIPISQYSKMANKIIVIISCSMFVEAKFAVFVPGQV